MRVCWPKTRREGWRAAEWVIEPIYCGWIHCSCVHGMHSRCYYPQRHVSQASRMSVCLGAPVRRVWMNQRGREGRVSEMWTRRPRKPLSTAQSSERDVEGVRSERRPQSLARPSRRVRPVTSLRTLPIRQLLRFSRLRYYSQVRWKISINALLS